MKTTMKFNDLIEKPAARKVMVLTEKQFQTLASSVINLMEQEQVIKTYLIKSKSNGK
jgi:hypothetical protein